MREHDFKPVKKHPLAKKGMVVWRCDRCDSEVLFSLKFTGNDVNQIMTTRMMCLDPFSNEV